MWCFRRQGKCVLKERVQGNSKRMNKMMDHDAKLDKQRSEDRKGVIEREGINNLIFK